jgi:hypothetical protein
MDAALETNNLYQIGVATHSYVDTWAHQNFIGYYNEFNSMAGVLEKMAPNIGHADASHNPDWRPWYGKTTGCSEKTNGWTIKRGSLALPDDSKTQPGRSLKTTFFQKWI